jgi:DNA polymerase-3 subunit delta
MFYFLFGEETFLLKRKLNEIVSRYFEKYQSSFNLFRIDGEESDPILRFKDVAKAVSMFKEKKVIIFQNVFSLDRNQKKELKTILLKESFAKKESPLIFFVEFQNVKKDDELFDFLKKNSVKCQEFKKLSLPSLKIFIQKEVLRIYQKPLSNLNLAKNYISQKAIQKIIEIFKDNLFEISNELQKLCAFKGGAKIEVQDIETLSKAKAEFEIFKIVENLLSGNKKEAIKNFLSLEKEGKSIETILPPTIFYVKNLLKIKSYLKGQKKKLSFKALAKDLQIHPFLIPKFYSLAKKFSFEKLKKLFFFLFSLDFKIKTGKISPQRALNYFFLSLEAPVDFAPKRS